MQYFLNIFLTNGKFSNYYGDFLDEGSCCRNNCIKSAKSYEYCFGILGYKPLLTDFFNYYIYCPVKGGSCAHV